MSAHLDLVSHRTDAGDAPRGAQRCLPLRVRRHVAGEGDRAFVRGHADVAGVDGRVRRDRGGDVVRELPVCQLTSFSVDGRVLAHLCRSIGVTGVSGRHTLCVIVRGGCPGHRTRARAMAGARCAKPA
jgi:hypothetical protein